MIFQRIMERHQLNSTISSSCPSKNGPTITVPSSRIWRCMDEEFNSNFLKSTQVSSQDEHQNQIRIPLSDSDVLPYGRRYISYNKDPAGEFHPSYEEVLTLCADTLGIELNLIQAAVQRFENELKLEEIWMREQYLQ